jgi:secreted Zn-dependent insulinase-like peptidase
VVDKQLKKLNELIDSYSGDKLSLPSPNPLIPDNFAIKSDKRHLTVNNKEPILLHQIDNKLELWLHQDHVYNMPRVVF